MNNLSHVAIIMDGNGRWGLKKRGLRNYGHLHGIKTVETVIKSSIIQKIPFLTLYTFSTENWKRPEKEVNFLFDLIRNSLKKNLKKIIKEEFKIRIIGNKKGLPKDINKTIKLIENKTYRNKAITINLALNYGSKEEIINACKSFNSKKQKLTIDNFEKYLYTKNIPNPDILIRTGGFSRLSNFFLLQLSYSELFFTQTLWPDLTKQEILNIFDKYLSIERKYGL